MEPIALDDALFERYLALIYRVSGIKIPTTKRILVSNRLRRRLKATGINDFAAYYAHLTSAAGAKEMPRFLEEITTNETYFFRDSHQFKWFGDEFLKEVSEKALARLRPKKINVWSAAASNGSELYSIAMTIQEKKADLALAGWIFNLLGTDLSEAVLKEAREGKYDSRALRLVAPDLLKRYFDQEPGASHWTIRPELRQLASWRPHNLMRPIIGGGPFDCIFLKNVLIYFDATSKQTVARHIVDALAPGGYLVLGPTELIPRLLDMLERRSSWLYQRPV